MIEATNDAEFEALIEFIRTSRGFDFSGYKTPSLMRRVRKRMQSVAAQQFSDYQDYLEVHPEEFSYLFNAVLINVTAFFRDPLAWDYLAKEIVPKILEHKATDQPIRIWSAGCASGEEAYTLAIVFAEALGLERFQQRVKIYATDMDEDALARARQASYTMKEVEPLPPPLRERYFDQKGERFVFHSDARRVVIFGRHDLLQDAPIPHLDLLVCRNTLMYFNAEAQVRILTRFHFALNDEGFLFLGKAEMLLTHGSFFSPVDLRYRIFSKAQQSLFLNRLPLLAQGTPEVANTLTRYVRLREAAFDTMPVATLVVDDNSNLVLASEKVRVMFGVTPTDLGRPFRDLELSYRPVELRSLIDEVKVKRLPVSLREVEWTAGPTETRYLDIQVTPLSDNGGTVFGTSVTFTDVSRPRRLKDELQRANQELETAYEELQSTNEELETSNEELQSTVEELQTTNEELQSTNEEMETMNEELQSTNEELQTTNETLRQRSGELSRTNLFLESILASVRAAIVVVDRTLNIQIWSPKAQDLWGLRPAEARGQSFLSLDLGLPVEQLKTPIRAMLAGESNLRELTLDAVNRRGKAMKCRVTCTPLSGAGKEIEGAVLLMEEWNSDEKP